MNETQWRAIVIDQHANLSYSLGALKIKLYNKDSTVTQQRIPLYNVSTVMIVSHQVRLSSCLIDQFRQRNVSLIFCDSGKIPSAELVGYSQLNQISARLKEQIGWTSEIKARVWERILELKLHSQKSLLKTLNLPFDESLWNNYASNIVNADQFNREGQAARIYFNTLFGKDFKRREESSINSALNYGYAILRSAMTRALTMRGFHPGLGVAHCAGSNPFNLTYDLIEPFRPFVDRIVYDRQSEPLDNKFKKMLISVTGTSVCYNSKTASLTTVMEYFITDVIQSLKTGKVTISEIVGT